MRVFKAKLKAVWWVLRSRGFVLATHQMCMAAVDDAASAVMITAQLEAQAHQLRNTMNKEQKDMTDEYKDKVRVRIVQSTEE